MAVLFLLLAVRTFAQPTDGILVSGQPDLAIIDTNGDGPDPMDCHIRGMTDTSGNLLITTMQDSHYSGGVQLRACSGNYTGYVDPTFPTDTSIFGMITMSSIIGGIPHALSFDGMFASQGGGGGGGAAVMASAPRIITQLTLTNTEFIGSGFICDSVAKVKLANGMPMGVGLLMDTPGYLHVQGIPFQTADLQSYVMKDVYIPKSDSILNFSLASAPSDILLQILLNGTCSRVPTLSEGNLILLALMLLVGGGWLLGYRRKLSEALPLP
ncbi:MAG TPA: hypothetical protein VMW56_17780 [Candidatus Margulisiibacteriota bacterium]|nr:hypothetical protein [Candidatus Margulisiibacteriota bacterium]